MADQQLDLIIRACRVFCADTGLDGPGAVAVRGDRIVASGPDVSGPAKQTLNFPDGTLLPGLVDLHAHPGPETWRFAVDADTNMLARGSTTVLSQGDAGSATWTHYRDKIIDRAKTRIRLAMNASVLGEYLDRGCVIHMEEVDVDRCVAAMEDGGDLIWGVAILLTAKATGYNDPREIMRRSIEIAERTGKPIIYGLRREPSDWPLAEQLAILRPGDIFTYCYQNDAESIVSDGRIVDSVWEARERGILFDTGFGIGGPDLGVAEAAIKDGFLPDTVSTDVHNRHRGYNPPHDMPGTLARIISVGMPETEAFKRSTLRPAEVLGLDGEIGTLAPGACADLTVLSDSPEPMLLANSENGGHHGPILEPTLTVRAGEVVAT